MNDVQEWILDNVGYIKELIAPTLQMRSKAIAENDPLFYDDIDKQCREIVASIIGIEFCKVKACSVEQFYDSITEEQWEVIWQTMI